MRELGDIVSTIAEGCASSAMVLAMHYNQVACLVRHGLGEPLVAEFVKGLADQQYLVASMTSEVGTCGDTRRSICAVHVADGCFNLTKEATTGSYCNEADAILVTARSNIDAAPSDQVLVLVLRDQRVLTQTTTWDTLGMRGTCSPGFRIESSGPEGQVLRVPFAEIAASSMVPYSHILWSALWTGIASSAHRKAAAFIRQQARQSLGTVPPGAPSLAALHADLQAMRNNWQSAAADFDRLVDEGGDPSQLAGMSWKLKMNNLKIACSEVAPRIVHGALQVIGVAAYRNDGPLSLGREYRDALSGSLMISNARINAASASMLLVTKEG